MALGARYGIIEDLENDEDILVLLVGDEYKKNWQVPTKDVQYVKDEFDLIGSIDVFVVYKK